MYPIGGLEHFLFSHILLYIGNFIIPTDELIFFRGVGIPPTRYIYMYIYICVCIRFGDTMRGWLNDIELTSGRHWHDAVAEL